MLRRQGSWTSNGEDIAVTLGEGTTVTRVHPR